MPTNPTVFVIDDDPAARESIGMLIRSLGLKVETFASAEQYLQTFDANRPGCVVTDMRMLGLSGLELQEQLVEMGERIPVILISAHANMQIAVKAMRNGAITFLEKPCQQQEIIDAVNEAIALDSRWRQESRESTEAKENYEKLNAGERDVMKLMMIGKANKVIANRLDVSLRTVEARRHNVFKKMNVDNIPDLTRLAMKIDELRAEIESNADTADDPEEE
ncbi:DNA-binding response regulator [Blastopirellula marina]|uniref:DNA-binding response regulator n=1 Tax=Blastopirellula marina TaxID=124 RepID=A0A2S8FUA0_9BACT|nr:MULTISPECIES: response regulator [Pirellulaceae]PQO35757.1 DNA-binding response regulator [Blastopirellula marina]RCS53331.1 DNA-binding response regulator [Bremerella cremea]